MLGKFELYNIKHQESSGQIVIIFQWNGNKGTHCHVFLFLTETRGSGLYVWKLQNIPIFGIMSQEHEKKWLSAAESKFRAAYGWLQNFRKRQNCA
jgi:hypothetical protein